MELLFKITVCFFAGAGAGLGTGFAGMSAAAVIGPVLITFLGVSPYEAVGIGLASDVLASAISSYNYKKNKNIDLKNGVIMMAAVLIMTVAGSFAAGFLPERAMGSAMQISMLIVGLRFLLKPVMTTKQQMESLPKNKRIRNALAGGIIIGFICGFIGAGGGMMMLFVLTSFLGYELHTAIGTSVFIMTFTALTGAVSHFTIGEIPDAATLFLCVLFTFIWAQIASKIANKAKTKTLNRVVGAVLVVTSAVILAVNFIK